MVLFRFPIVDDYWFCRTSIFDFQFERLPSTLNLLDCLFWTVYFHIWFFENTPFWSYKVKLECSITGKPVPTIRWFKGGSNRKLKSANGFQIEDLESQNNTATSILTIPDPKSIHEANYHCMAYNLARKDGLHSRTYSLEVRQKPIIGHITCPRPQLSQEKERQSTELEANVEADPSSHLRVVWLYQESSGAGINKWKEINSTMFPKKYHIELLSIDNSKRLKKASLKIKNLRSGCHQKIRLNQNWTVLWIQLGPFI